MFTCSVLLRGGRGAADRYLLCVGSTHRVPATLGLPPLTGVCAFPVYTAQAAGCSIWSVPCVACGSSFRVFHKSADSVGPAFFAFPSSSSSGSQELDGCTLPRCAFSPPQSQPQFPLRQLGACALCLAAILPADVDHPESQEVFG